MTGQEMYDFASLLWPLNRSLTGEGTRETLAQVQDRLRMRVSWWESGTKCFDWTVPDEWNVRQAYIEGPDGERIADFGENNLHLVGYSEPIDTVMSLEELQPHLHSLSGMPDAIPYVTSYYKRTWGFCLTENQRKALQPGQYRVVIGADLKPGKMHYGELMLPGKTTQEVLLSTYVCHPSMANDNLSGIVVTTALARWLMEQPRRYTYRILFVPETIGSIAYLSMHRDEMLQKTVAGFVVACCGDDIRYTVVSSPGGDTLADRVAKQVYRRTRTIIVPWIAVRGSDERQYCSPRVVLPVVVSMRSGWTGYPEYHTSKDDLTVISPAGLQGGFDSLRRCLETLEDNKICRNVHICEPFMERRGIYERRLMDIIACCDGRRDTLAIAEMLDRPCGEIVAATRRLVAHGILEAVA